MTEDIKTQVEATLEKVAKTHPADIEYRAIINQATTQITSLINEAKVKELEGVWDEGYERWSNAPQSDKYSQTQHVSKALFDRIEELKERAKELNENLE